MLKGWQKILSTVTLALLQTHHVQGREWTSYLSWKGNPNYITFLASNMQGSEAKEMFYLSSFEEIHCIINVF